MKVQIGDLESKLKELRAQRKSDEDKVNVVKRSSKGYWVSLNLEQDLRLGIDVLMKVIYLRSEA